MNQANLISAVAIMLISSTLYGAPELKPNLVYIMADDCTHSDIGCYGGQAYTPNIDKLATEGMRLTRCFQAAPMCSPTRHNIYTGLYPVKSGAYPNHTFAKAGTKSIVHYLKALGYRVALSGKTHIAPKTVFPFEYSAQNKNPDMGAINRLMTESKKLNIPFCLFATSNEPHSPYNKGDDSRYPPAILDGKSFINLLKGNTNQHKKYVYGIMTTRGINNGSDHFGIRSIRSTTHKLIVNLSPEIEFRNACTQSAVFKSWETKAAAGDQDAATKVKRYKIRPAIELYDICKDPYEMINIAGNPENAPIIKELQSKLDAWMLDQGDRGKQTELEAKEHQGRRSHKKGGKKKRSA